MELLKQATNSISNCKLIPRNLCGEGISIGSPVNMCAIGNKVIWPTGGVISHSLVSHPRLQSVLWCAGVFPRMTRPVCGVPVVPVPRQSCWAPLASCFQKQFHHVSVVEAKKKKPSQSACIQLLSPESCVSSALFFCQFEGTWDEQHKHILPWKRCRNEVKFPDALSSDDEKINSRIMWYLEKAWQDECLLSHVVLGKYLGSKSYSEW